MSIKQLLLVILPSVLIIVACIFFVPIIIKPQADKPDRFRELERQDNTESDTLYIFTADIYLIPVSSSLRHEDITQSIRDGRFDRWLIELQAIGYQWTGSFGYPPYNKLPFIKKDSTHP